MAKGIVVYYSRSGNTKKMAEVIAEGMNEAQLPTECKSVEKVKADELRSYDAIVLGSPTYYGQMAGPLKELIDETELWTARSVRPFPAPLISAGVMKPP